MDLVHKMGTVPGLDKKGSMNESPWKKTGGGKEVIRGKLGWTRTCGSDDNSPKLMEQQNNAGPRR